MTTENAAKVVSGFNPIEMTVYNSFNEKQLADFIEGVDKLINVTTLPGRITLSRTYYECCNLPPNLVNKADKKFVIDFIIGMNPGQDYIQERFSSIRLQKNYRSLSQKIRTSCIEF